MALQSLAAIELQKGGLNFYNPHYLTLLNTIKTQLKLPQQAETHIDVCKAIEALGGEKFEGYKPPYNNPIDWEFVKTIPADQQVLIKTNKGDIALQLFVDDAPGTTSNFLKLVDSSFYDGKFFHRVVPQFVIQGGCPRGDGWGSLDWSQRSEFSNYQNYEAGTVGVASAGKDTEGVQFFITHCPTPHLDGRYTIFARVVSGIDVVHQIEVGDRMIRVTRK
jgi:cyclophilin family peptidyl-prolyl cis-trans isomerase